MRFCSSQWRSSSSGEIAEALELADKAIGLNPIRPAYYSFFHAMILWGNERYQQALDEEEECLRKARQPLVAPIPIA